MSRNPRSWAYPAMALASVLAIACTESTTNPNAAGPSFNVTADPKLVTVCKDASSPAGTYDFTVAQEGGRGGTLLAGASFSLGAGECVDVWEALPDPPQPDPAVFVTVAELAPPQGVQFDSLVGNGDADGPFFTTSPSWTVRVNYYHGALYNFFNSEVPQVGGEGCTPGYWKNHLDSWAGTGFAPGDDFDATFGVNAFNPNITLLAAANLGGGGLNKLARHAVAALLNAASGDVDYPQSAAGVIAAVAAAINAGTYEPLATQLDTWNNLGCPIN
jgi:hypothetical protein